jgi:hypothetical protein
MILENFDAILIYAQKKGFDYIWDEEICIYTLDVRPPDI